MKIKKWILISGLLSMAGLSLAVRFNNAGSGDDWATPGNWAGGSVPLSTETAEFNYAGAVGRLTTATTVDRLVIGDNESGGLIVDGGTLTVSNGWNAVNYNRPGTLTIQNGGSVTMEDYFSVGFFNSMGGAVTIGDGSFRVNNTYYHSLYFNAANGATDSRTTVLAGGVLDVNQMDLKSGVLDMAGGTVYIRNNIGSTVNTWIADGRVVGYGGTGSVFVTWDSATGRTVVTGVADSGGNATAPDLRDVNQDGFDDFVHISNDNGVFSANLLLSDGSVFSNAVLSGSVSNHAAEDKWFTGDFDGDGALDLARLWGGTDGNVYCEVETTLQDGVLNLVSWASANGSYSASQRWFRGDFNGDGKDDLASMPYNGDDLVVNVYLSTGSGFARSTWWNTSSGRAAKDRFFVGDFDGDGADDMAQLSSSGGNAVCKLLSVNAGGTAFQQVNWSPAGYAYDSNARWYPGDYDGNGLLDFAVVRSESDQAKADVLLSNVGGFAVQLNWINGTDAYIYGDQAWYPGDYDGDGTADLIKIQNDNSLLSADVYVSTGAGFNRATWIAQTGEFQDSGDFFLTDFNGDGKEDLCAVKRLNGASVMDAYVSTGTSFSQVTNTYAQTARLESLRGAPQVRAHKYFDPHFIVGPMAANGGDYAAVCKSGQDIYLKQQAVYARTDQSSSALQAYADQQVFETFEAKTVGDFAWIIRTQNQHGFIRVAGYSSTLIQNVCGDGRRYDLTAQDITNGFSGGGTHFFGGRNASHQRFNRIYNFSSVGQSVIKIQEADSNKMDINHGNRVQNSFVFGAGVDPRGNGRNPVWNGPWADAIGMAHRDTHVRNNIVIDGTDVGIVLFTAPSTVVEDNVVATISRSGLGGINLLDCFFYNQWGINGIDAEGRRQHDFSSLVQHNYLDARGSRMDVGIPVGNRTWGPSGSVSTENPYGTQIINNTLDGKAFAYGIAVANAYNTTATGNVSYATHSGVGGYFNTATGLTPDPASAFAYCPAHAFNGTYGPEFSPTVKPDGLNFILFNTWHSRSANPANGYLTVFYEVPEAEATVEMAFSEILRREPTPSELTTYRDRLLADSTLLADDLRVELMNLPEFDILYPAFSGAKTLNGMQIHRVNVWVELLEELDAARYDDVGNYPVAKSFYQDALAALNDSDLQPPATFFIAPIVGEAMEVGTSLNVLAAASDSNGTIDNVRLYLDGALVRQIDSAPYEWGASDPLLSNLAAGSYVLRLVATDNDGLTSEALQTVAVKIRPTTMQFTNGGSGDDWDNPLNWDSGMRPAAATTVKFNSGGAIGCITNDVGTIKAVQIGVNGSGGLEIDGGALNVSGGWNAVGYNSSGSLVIKNGSVTLGGYCSVGFNNSNGGSVVISNGMLRVSEIYYHSLYYNSANGATDSRTTIQKDGLLDVNHLDLKSGVMDVASGTVVIRNNITSSVNDWIADGRLIAYGGAGTVVFDYNVTHPGWTTITSEAPGISFANWASSWGVNIGPETNDYDNDQRNNFYEYAFNGNPTDAADQGVDPMLGNESGQLLYTYLQRNDDLGLVYMVETSTNLVSNVWNSESYSVLGTNVIGGVFDEVTVEVETTTEQRFIRVNVTEP